MLTTATHPLPAAPSAARPSRVAAAARDALYLVSGLPIGIVGFTVAVGAWSTALGLLTSGAWRWALPADGDEGLWLELLDDPGVEHALLRAVVGLALVPVAYLLCRGLARGLARVARAICG